MSNSYRGVAHADLLEQSPSLLQFQESNRKILPLDKVLGESSPTSKGAGHILLDKDERELVKKGDEVTKEEMWKLLENKRFERLKSSAINL